MCIRQDDIKMHEYIIASHINVLNANNLNMTKNVLNINNNAILNQHVIEPGGSIWQSFVEVIKGKEKNLSLSHFLGKFAGTFFFLS